MPVLSQTTEVVGNARTEEIVLYGSSPIQVHSQVFATFLSNTLYASRSMGRSTQSRTPDMGNSELCESHLSRKTLINSRR